MKREGLTIYITGKVGSGKTTALNICMNAFKEIGYKPKKCKRIDSWISIIASEMFEVCIK